MTSAQVIPHPRQHAGRAVIGLRAKADAMDRALKLSARGELQPADLATLWCIATNTDGATGDCKRLVRWIAARVGDDTSDRSRTKRSLRRLVDAGLIERRANIIPGAREKGASTYRLAGHPRPDLGSHVTQPQGTGDPVDFPGDTSPDAPPPTGETPHEDGGGAVTQQDGPSGSPRILDILAAKFRCRRDLWQPDVERWTAALGEPELRRQVDEASAAGEDRDQLRDRLTAAYRAANRERPNNPDTASPPAAHGSDPPTSPTNAHWRAKAQPLCQAFGTQHYRSWLASCIPIADDGETLHLAVPTAFYRDWIKHQHDFRLLEVVLDRRVVLTLPDEAAQLVGLALPRQAFEAEKARAERQLRDRPPDASPS